MQHHRSFIFADRETDLWLVDARLQSIRRQVRGLTDGIEQLRDEIDSVSRDIERRLGTDDLNTFGGN